ncbi:MAG: hypothetical protein IT244_08660 [Bacteroidia bacterium]|nr:hypothetical protein [Bacteroidia bacterium]
MSCFANYIKTIKRAALLLSLVLFSCNSNSQLENMQEYFRSHERDFNVLLKNTIDYTHTAKISEYPFYINSDTLTDQDLTNIMENLNVDQITIEKYNTGARKFKFWLEKFNGKDFEMRFYTADSVSTSDSIVMVGDFTRIRLNPYWSIEEELGM